MKLSFIVLLVLCMVLTLNAQKNSTDKKIVHARMVDNPPTIDGVLSETFWADIEAATDFIIYEPYNGKPSYFRTEVRFAYSQTAIYIGARMFDPHPDSILCELGQRDEALELNSDAFAIEISPFNDNLNAFGFSVSSSGVVADLKTTGQNRDESWDAVWDAAVLIDSLGWTCEMMIPYSAIRFPNKEEQIWGLNCWRQVRRVREWSTWSFVDKNNDSFLHQAGLLLGISGIEPPIRLSVNPYASLYLFKVDGKPELKLNGGMDLKYGIDQSYTLDMTLIPDFGQVESDEIVLNLSPFEIQYDEKRPFFTEGNELFGRGGIFYTRRIGGQPQFIEHGKDSLMEGETLASPPSETRLFNALKVTGRDKQGLGTGILNAVTRPVRVEAIAEDSSYREVLMQPVMNYNLLVIDRSLRQNSYVSFANSNVVRAGEKYMANVSALEFDLNNKELDYGLFGLARYSYKQAPNKDLKQGVCYYLGGGKRTGKFIWALANTGVSKQFDQNDMGYLEKTNFNETELALAFRQFQPKGIFINYSGTFELEYSAVFEGFKYTQFKGNFDSHAMLKNYFFMGLNLEYSPFPTHDYYEPRVDGWYFKIPPYFSWNVYFSSDYRKMLALDGRFGTDFTFNDPYHGYWITIEPRFRPSDRLLIIPSFRINQRWDEQGFVDKETEPVPEVRIYFGDRDVIAVTNSVYSTYRFSPNASLSLRIRHYWSKALYTNFHQLLPNGELTQTAKEFDSDINYNIYSLDMGFHWNFAPGSELSLVWKQLSEDSQGKIIPHYLDNFFHSIEGDLHSNISLKIIYYIDYQSLKNRRA